MLFFGNIAPYKGLGCLTAAFEELSTRDRDSFIYYCLGRVKGSQHYWNKIQQTLERDGVGDRVIATVKYVPDEETEVYFKVAVYVLVLPYTHVFQSGVLFLGYSFRLPAIAADVGNLKEEIIEGDTGFVFQAKGLIRPDRQN